MLVWSCVWAAHVLRGRLVVNAHAQARRCMPPPWRAVDASTPRRPCRLA